jgi:RNA polymerase sigma-70 factor, ECF subfamily
MAAVGLLPEAGRGHASDCSRAAYDLAMQGAGAASSPGFAERAVVSSHEEDHALPLRLRARDEAALEALYDRYSGLVFTLALRIVGDRHLAEEVLQDTFWRCWVGAEQFDPRRGRPAGWLLGVARNRAIDLLRGRQHQARLHERDSTVADRAEWPTLALEQHGVHQPDAHEAILLRDTLGHALRDLSSAQRQTIELAYYGGLTEVEIAVTLGVPLGTVKTRMRDGMERLRTMLRPIFAAATEPERP